MQDTWVQSLGWKNPLEKELETHSSILAWRIPWTRSLVGYSPRGHKESDTTKWLTHTVAMRVTITAAIWPIPWQWNSAAEGRAGNTLPSPNCQPRTQPSIPSPSWDPLLSGTAPSSRNSTDPGQGLKPWCFHSPCWRGEAGIAWASKGRGRAPSSSTWSPNWIAFRPLLGRSSCA